MHAKKTNRQPKSTIGLSFKKLCQSCVKTVSNHNPHTPQSLILQGFTRKYKASMQYINNVRLEKSVEQFEHGNTSILDVSLSVGFRNLSYFHRAFKKKYHMTPRSFIQKLEQFQ